MLFGCHLFEICTIERHDKNIRRVVGGKWAMMSMGRKGGNSNHNLNGEHFLDQGIYEILQNQNYDYDSRCAGYLTGKRSRFIVAVAFCVCGSLSNI